MERSLLLAVYVTLRVVRDEYAIGTLAISVLLFLAVDAAPRENDQSYEPGDVETVAGHVARVEALPSADGRRDVTVVLRTAIGDEVRVALAPQRVVRSMGLRLRSGDAVQVTGWRIVRGKPSLLAAEISKGTQLFVLRDRHGVAAWGPRRRLKRRPTHRIDRPE